MAKRKRSYYPRRRSYRRKYSYVPPYSYLSASQLNPNASEPERKKWFAESRFGPSLGQLRRYPTVGPPTPDQIAMRQAFNYYGDGDYWSDIKKGKWFGKSKGMGDLFRWGGKLAGGYLGQPEIGHQLGGDVSKWLGFGDYARPQVSNQIAGGGTQPSGASKPTFVNATDMSGDVWISHREYVGDVVVPTGTAGGFSITSFPIKPVPGDGETSTFPWLQQIAKNFEMYDFEGLMFQYIPTSGEGAGTSTNSLGKVIMCTNYDPLASAFADSVTMQNYDYATSCKPSVGMIHGVETANKQASIDMLYIDDGETTRDPLFQSIGTFQVATQGVPASEPDADINLGELWVTYRVKLSRARLAPSS